MAKSCRRVTGLPLADLTGESLGLEVTGKLKKNSQRKKIHTISPTEQVPEKMADTDLAKQPIQGISLHKIRELQWKQIRCCMVVLRDKRVCFNVAASSASHFYRQARRPSTSFNLPFQ